MFPAFKHFFVYVYILLSTFTSRLLSSYPQYQLFIRNSSKVGTPGTLTRFRLGITEKNIIERNHEIIIFVSDWIIQ